MSDQQVPQWSEQQCADLYNQPRGQAVQFQHCDAENSPAHYQPSTYRGQNDVEPEPVQNQSEVESLMRPDEEPSHTTSQHSYVVSRQSFHDQRRGVESQRTRSPRKLWTPFWLKIPTLIAFLLLFTACWVALLLLWQYTKGHNGLAITLSSNHYAWTYGPTAVLVVVVSLWRQVDFYSKYTQPWYEMKKSAAPAAKSVLLDYVSPLQLVSLSTSLRNRHWAVTGSAAGFVILKLIITFSTSLLVSKPGDTALPVPVSLTTVFDALQIWDKVNSTNYQGVSADPVYDYLGRLNGKLDDPAGIKDNYAFQSFDFDKGPLDLTSVSAGVDVFVPKVTCEEAVIERTQPDPPTYAYSTTWLYFSVDTDSCHLGHDNFSVVIVDTCWTGCAAYTLFYDMRLVNCSQPTVSRSPSGYGIYPSQDSVDGDYRYALIAVNYTSLLNETNDNTTTTPQSASAVVCKVDYEIIPGNLTLSVESGDLNLNLGSEKGHKLTGLQYLQLSELVFSSLNAAAGIFGDIAITRYFELQEPSAAAGAVFPFMAKLKGEDKPTSNSLEQFFDSKVMNDAAEQVLEGVTLLVAQRNVLIPGKAAVEGVGTYTEHRLHINTSSLWVMIAGFLLLCLLTVLIMFTGPRNTVSRNPGPMASDAAILAASPQLNQLLKGTAGSGFAAIEARLDSHLFKARADASFGLEVTEQGPILSSPSHHSIQEFWTPVPIRPWALTIMLILPMIAIGVLEGLQQYSNNHMGIFTVLDDSSTSISGIRYASTLGVLLTATLFNSMDFEIAVFAPYSKLRSGNVPSRQSLQSFLLGETPVLALFQAIRGHHIGAGFSNIAGLVGSVLTIVVSGLWLVDHSVGFELSIGARTLDTWNVNWQDSVLDDRGAARTFNNIQRKADGNSSGTWEDLVLPMVDSVSLPGTTSRNTSHGNYTITVPALRPVLDCTIVPEDQINFGFFTVPILNYTLYGVDVQASADLPEGCFGGPGGNLTYTSFNISLVGHASLDGHAYDEKARIAKFFDLHMGPWETTINASYWIPFGESTENVQQPSNPDGCPSIGVIIGELHTTEQRPDLVTALVCYQRIQQVQTSVTYIGDPRDGKLSLEFPPTPDEKSAKYLTNGTEGVTAFNYRVEGHFTDSMTEFGPDAAASGQVRLDMFFDHIVKAPSPTSFDDMLGVKNQQKLIEQVGKLYRGYMVQAITLNMRQNADAGKGQEVKSVFTEPIARLVVNTQSKLVLQTLLAVMTVCGIIAISTIKLRGTLPHNPCSIAGAMSLFAGSELCDRGIEQRSLLPEGTEWAKEKEMTRVLDGLAFSLGWWDSKEGTRRFGVGVGSASISGTLIAPKRP